MLNIENVYDEIDDAFSEQIEFLRKLVQCKSIIFNEKSVQVLMAQKLRQLELDVDVFEPDVHKLSDEEDYSPVEWGYAGRPIVVGVWKSKSQKGRSLILNGHADVVPVEAEEHQWTYDPWRGDVVDGKMFGRGAGDMKSGLAAIVYAVEALKKTGVELDGDVIIQSVIEEEASGNGTLACFTRGYYADAAIIAETNGPKILTVQPGSLWLRIRVFGSAGHVQGLSPSVNAIEKAYYLIKKIKDIEAESNEKKHPSYEGIENPLNFAIGMIRGGVWPSSTPSSCDFTVRFAINPGEEPNDAAGKFTSSLMERLSNDDWFREHPPQFNWFGHRHRGFVLDLENEFYRVLSEKHQDYFKKPIEYHIAQACSDQVYFINRGIPATCYGPTGYNAHAADEYVDLETMRDATKVFASFIVDWCNRSR